MNIVEAIKDKKDINKLKKALPDRERLMFVIGINTGLRISDILSLRVSDMIDAKGKPKDKVVIYESKTKKRKEFPLNKAVCAELKKMKFEGMDGFIVPSQKGGAISRVQAYRLLNAAADRAELSFDIGTHSLRKTFGYHAIKNGTPVHVVQSLLNHSSSRETLRYIGLTQDIMDDVYMNMNI